VPSPPNKANAQALYMCRGFLSVSHQFQPPCARVRQPTGARTSLPEIAALSYSKYFRPNALAWYLDDMHLAMLGTCEQSTWTFPNGRLDMTQPENEMQCIVFMPYGCQRLNVLLKSLQLRIDVNYLQVKAHCQIIIIWPQMQSDLTRFSMFRTYHKSTCCL